MSRVNMWFDMSQAELSTLMSASWSVLDSNYHWRETTISYSFVTEGRSVLANFSTMTRGNSTSLKRNGKITSGS